jgi:hemerythrin
MTIQWTPALSVGHDEIDRQHQELFRRLSALLEAMLRGDRAEIGRLFEFLGTYVVEHFGAEERLMRGSDFPGYVVHKAAHERFVRDYQELRKMLDAHGATSAVAIRTKTWIVDWLTAHIGATDQALARHLRARVA